MTEREKHGKALWDFATYFYRAPGIQSACLAMQDQAGADVPFLIFLVCAAQRGQTFEAEDLRRIDSAIAQWRHDVVQPLRQIRRQLKSSPQASVQRFREIVKAAELEAEREEIARLSPFLIEKTATQQMNIADLTLYNMRAYIQLIPSAEGPHLDEFLARVREFHGR